MPTLNLIRTVEVRADDNDPRVVVEVRSAIAAGTLAEISPAQPGDSRPWRRRPLDPSSKTYLPSVDEGRGTTWATFNNLANGVYEARSVRDRGRRPLRVVFLVDGGEIAVLSDSGDDRAVLRALGWERAAAMTNACGRLSR